MPSSLTPKDFGAFGGNVDNHIALQAWMDAGGGTVDRFYTSSRTLLYGSGFRANGIGASLCGIEAHPSMKEADALLLNKNISYDLPVDVDIHMNNLTLGGPELVRKPRAQGLIGLVGVKSAVFDHILFRDWERDIIVAGNTFDIIIEDCEFTRWGWAGPFEGIGTGQFVGGCAIFCWRMCWNWGVLNNHFHNAYLGGGLWMPNEIDMPGSSHTFRCSGNVFDGMVEFAVAGMPRKTVLTGNIVRNIKKVDVSGHGFELHGIDAVVADNIIEDCESAGIFFFNPHNVVIRGNVLRNTIGCGIIIHSAPEDWGVGGPPDGLVITGNSVTCDHTKMADHGILFYQGGGGLANNVMCYGNNLCGPQMWKKRPIEVTEGFKGEHCFIAYAF